MHKTSRRPPVKSPIFTLGDIFGADEILEVLRDSVTGAPLLLHSAAGEFRNAPRMRLRGKTFLPAKLEDGLSRALIFPSGISPYGTTAELFALVRDSFAFRGIPEDAAVRATYFVFASWFTDLLSFAPTLIVDGPTIEVRFLFALLGCCVRRPLHLAALNIDALVALPPNLCPTLLLDALQVSPSTLNVLSNATSNTYVFLGNKCANIRAAKVLSLQNMRSDESRPIGLHLNLTPISEKIPLINAEDAKRLADEIQPRLLMYRCLNFDAVKRSRTDIPDLPSAFRLLAWVFGSAIVGSPELQSGLEIVLRGEYETIRQGMWTDPSGVIIEAALSFCHRQDADVVYVGKIADTANLILQARSGYGQLEAKKVGTMLRGLGFAPKRNAGGFCIQLDEQTRKRIHQLARDFDVAAIQEGIAARCTSCET
jgi:hypothetical protein